MSVIVPIVPRGGNSKPPNLIAKKQISPSKMWCFTFNNYSQSDISSIVPIILENCVKSIVGREVGESNTPHLQGYCYFKKKVRPLSVFKSMKIHWEKAKGSDTQNYAYCSKGGDILVNIGFPIPPKTINRLDFYQWQEELVKVFETPCKWNDRTIYWRHGDANIGKTQFAKWLCVHLNAVVIGGHQRHMLAQVQKQKAPIYIVLLSYGDDNVSYQAIEQIKDGLFTSHFGTDNNSMEVRDAPHILVIGNLSPNLDNKYFHDGKYDVSEVFKC